MTSMDTAYKFAFVAFSVDDVREELRERRENDELGEAESYLESLPDSALFFALKTAYERGASIVDAYADGYSVLDMESLAAIAKRI